MKKIQNYQKYNWLLIFIRYESEIERVIEVQTKQEVQIKEQNTILLEKSSDDLRRKYETISETRMNEYMVEKEKLEARIAEMEICLDEIKRQLDSEVEKSKEKSTELIALNKQKFKLMAQVFISFWKKSLKKN